MCGFTNGCTGEPHAKDVKSQQSTEVPSGKGSFLSSHTIFERLRFSKPSVHPVFVQTVACGLCNVPNCVMSQMRQLQRLSVTVLF
jgi:hypothetical protein